jgi:hypothetical protein
LITAFVLLGLQIWLLVAVHHHWRDVFTVFAFTAGWFSPLFCYVAVRRISVAGFTWPWFLLALATLLSTALAAYSFYYSVQHAVR